MDESVKKLISGSECPYCACGTKLVEGDVIYPLWVNHVPRPSFLNKKYYVCLMDADHYVGTYADNITSLGRLADKELRYWKSKGHTVFDPLWKNSRYFKTQREAYRWLSAQMNVPLELTHFGMFTVEQCRRAIEICSKLEK